MKERRGPIGVRGFGPPIGPFSVRMSQGDGTKGEPIARFDPRAVRRSEPSSQGEVQTAPVVRRDRFAIRLTDPMRDCCHQAGWRRHHSLLHFPAAVDDHKAGFNREGRTWNDHRHRARAISVDLVGAECRAVPNGAGELSVRAVDMCEVAVTVVGAEAGADE